MKKWILLLAVTVLGYWLIDIGYSVMSHIDGLLLKGMGGGILTLVGILIREFEEE